MAFATHLLIHHAQCVEMARSLLAKPYIDRSVRDFAARIEPQQAHQIEQLRAWLAGWSSPVPAPDGSTGGLGNLLDRVPPPVPGMMSADDMAALRRLNGVEGAKLYLAMLVNHEAGAIQIAALELLDGRNGEAKRLARAIVETDQTRVSAANELLDGRIHPPGKF